MGGDGTAQNHGGDGGTGALAKPHPEIEHRFEAECREQAAMALLMRDVTGDAMIKRERCEARKRRDGGGDDVTIQQNGDA